MKQTLAEQGMYREQESRHPERPEHTEAEQKPVGGQGRALNTCLRGGRNL